MKAALLTELGGTPAAVDFDRPEPQGSLQVIEVEAAGMNPVDVNISRGLQFPPPLPCVVGLEGIGRTADGRRVYFDSAKQPHGSFAEYCLVAEEGLMDIPEGIDAAAAMPFGIAGLAAWTGLGWKAAMENEETVLILGASSIVGQIGVQVAKRLGAGRVVAAARDEEVLARCAELGADATVRLGGEHEQLVAELKEAAGGGFDVVLDLLWGEPLVAALGAMAEFGRVIQIGGSAAQVGEIPARPIRNPGISILGHINYHVPVAGREEAFAAMCEMSLAGDLVIPVEEIALADVAQAWERQQGGPHAKLVIRP
jgi:NADPH:quinone reductase-like Zn-dependent oxidoreductase